MSNQLHSLALTGATSSIGVHVINECIKRSIRVVALVHASSPRASRVPRHPLVQQVNCGLEEMRSLELPGVTCDAFLHLAWSETKSTLRNNLLPQVKNIEYSLDSVELAYRLGCHTYMGAGSQAEYGKKNEVLTENIPVTPDTAYGMAKLCAGQMTRLSCKNKGMRHIWPRIVSTYGPYSPEQTVLAYMLRTMLEGGKPELSGGDQIWDFLYLKDAANALLALLEKGRDGEIYLISGGSSRPLKDYLQEAKDAVDPTADLCLGAVPYGPNTVMHLAADISKIKTETGWEPEYTFDRGIMETIEWARDHYQL